MKWVATWCLSCFIELIIFTNFSTWYPKFVFAWLCIYFIKTFYGVVFLPGILGPCMIPSAWPRSSSARSLRMAPARSDRTLRVSLPWIVLASAQRCRPCSVRGPVLFPPWLAHLFLPFEAEARHCCLVRLDLAWHWTQRIRPPAVTKVKLFDMDSY